MFIESVWKVVFRKVRGYGFLKVRESSRRLMGVESSRKVRGYGHRKLSVKGANGRLGKVISKAENAQRSVSEVVRGRALVRSSEVR